MTPITVRPTRADLSLAKIISACTGPRADHEPSAPALQSQRIASTDGLDLLAEQIAGLALNRIFSHQLELRIRLLLPNRNFGKRNGDRAIAERILPRLLHAIYVVPGYVHKCLSGRTSFSSKSAAGMGVIDVRY